MIPLGLQNLNWIFRRSRNEWVYSFDTEHGHEHEKVYNIICKYENVPIKLSSRNAVWLLIFFLYIWRNFSTYAHYLNLYRYVHLFLCIYKLLIYEFTIALIRNAYNVGWFGRNKINTVFLSHLMKQYNNLALLHWLISAGTNRQFEQIFKENT